MKFERGMEWRKRNLKLSARRMVKYSVEAVHRVMEFYITSVLLSSEKAIIHKLMESRH